MKMPTEMRNFRISALTEALSVVSLALVVITVISPYWGRFSNEGHPNSGDLVTGYFGLWTVCKDLPQGRSFCGSNVTAFRLPTWSFIAGVIAVVGVVSQGVAFVVGVCLLLMLKSQERVCLPYRPCVVMRFVLCTVSVLMAVVAVALASIRPDERLPYNLMKGWTFYVHILVIVVEVATALCSVYDLVLSRRLGGDPTFYSRDPSGSNALTYSNPSFTSDDQTSSRMRNSSSNSLSSTASSVRSVPNGSNSNMSRLQQARILSGRTSPHRIRPGSGRLSNGSSKGGRGGSGRGNRGSQHGGSKQRPSVAVTSSSGNPYSSPSMSGLVDASGTTDSVDQGSTSSILNGSFGSIESSYATTSSIISGSSVSSNPMALSPRKSSLKKRRTDVPPSPMGTGSVASGDSILGFQNPGFAEPRVGSIKRVRIASQSTDV